MGKGGQIRQNKLAGEKSPYLLQHACNPVDWYPWGDEAFRVAKERDVPIFLSIGYSTCHWCHVMEKESFEDEGVARLLNNGFVCVKVDREERPDIDQLYMSVAQMAIGSGGWPLNLIMTPDRKPFFVTTYIPKTGRQGILGLEDLIPKVSQLWMEERGRLLESADSIVEALRNAKELSGPFPSEDIIIQTYDELALAFDEANGGFGNRPKFPSTHNLMFLMRYWRTRGSEHALHMVEKTLEAMSMGGIRDHVGGGFHRYATDSKWIVPHFEKMLYDQAMIAVALCEAYQATGKDFYGEVAQSVFSYVMSKMTSPDGTFFSAEDADSDGEEGAYYLWSASELSDIFEGDDLRAALGLFNITDEGNFRDEATGRRMGKNIIYRDKRENEIFDLTGVGDKGSKKRLDEILGKMGAYRAKRRPVAMDDKVLTDWNGLMISAFAIGYKCLQREEYLLHARRAADWLMGRMLREDGTLLHRYRDGEAAFDGNIDDYAFLIWGLLELYDASFDLPFLWHAKDLTDKAIELFWDEGNGGFYISPASRKDLVSRQKEAYDGAIPSGNSVMALCLIRLSRILGKPLYDRKAAGTVCAFSSAMAARPSAHTFLIMAVGAIQGPTSELIVVGEEGSEDTRRLIAKRDELFLPHNFTFVRYAGMDEGQIPGYAKAMVAKNDSAEAYVCTNKTCKQPTSDPDRMAEELIRIYRDAV